MDGRGARGRTSTLETHGTRRAFERDRQLQAAGYRVIRITWRQLDDPDTIASELRELLRDTVSPS